MRALTKQGDDVTELHELKAGEEGDALVARIRILMGNDSKRDSDWSANGPIGKVRGCAPPRVSTEGTIHILIVACHPTPTLSAI